MNPSPTALLVAAVALCPFRSAAATAPDQPADASVRRLSTEARAWTGDFDAMIERRRIRVLVPFSRTLYFNDKGRERGLSADGVRAFERWLNTKYAKQLGNRPLTVLIVPTTRDRLLTDVARGLGDVAVGNITITPERLELVDFVPALGAPPLNEVVVTGPKAAPVATLDELAGRTVHVRRTSSYHDSLTALNARFGREGKPAVNVVPIADALEDEDILEMLDVGILEAVVVDDWMAKMWAQILPKIRVHEQVILRSGGQVGWATRKGSPKLNAEIAAYMKAEGTKGIVAGRLAQHMKRVKRLKDPTASDDRKRFVQLYALFEKYGQQYRFDPLMLAAQGYQESQLNQDAKSHVGAVGVMQIMPATGKSLAVGDIRLAEPNVHAGAKYMDQLMTRYFADAKFDQVNRTLFAFASYNAGPGNMRKMRGAAEQRGLDPDQWFNNVEIVTAQKIGVETTTYVRNIYKYYVAYSLIEDAQAKAQSAREQLTPGVK
jgi:membrane-bound lytic murein transglycosylase MltF